VSGALYELTYYVAVLHLLTSHEECHLGSMTPMSRVTFTTATQIFR